MGSQDFVMIVIVSYSVTLDRPCFGCTTLKDVIFTEWSFRECYVIDLVHYNVQWCAGLLQHHKSLNLDDFMDKARQLLRIKWNERRTVGKKLDGLILPHIIKKLNAKTRELNLEVVQSSQEVAEVTALGGSGFRFVVNLQERTCT